MDSEVIPTDPRFKLVIYQDDSPLDPDEDCSDVFLVHHHRQFWHTHKSLPFTKTLDEMVSWLMVYTGAHHDADDPDNEQFVAHTEALRAEWVLFRLDSYIHGGVVLALSDSTQAHSFPDRQFDVSRCGVVLIRRAAFAPPERGTESVGEHVQLEQAFWAKIAQAHVDDWNKYLSGEVYGYDVSDAATGESCEDCGGFYDRAECVREALDVVANLVATADVKEAAHIEFLNGLDDEKIDDLVHDEKSEEASAICNEGKEAAVAYLLESGWTRVDLVRRAGGWRDMHPHGVQPTLFLSTRHMPSTEPSWGGPDGPRVVKHAYGFVVFVAGGVEPHPDEPAWLAAVLAYARKHDCVTIDFDATGDIVDELPQWEW